MTSQQIEQRRRATVNPNANEPLSASDIRKLLHYDEEVGVFTWKAREGADRTTKSWNTRYAGARADKVRLKDGYRQIGVMGKNYLAHRVAWVFMRGNWPIGLIDHINGVRDDNRGLNLREVSDKENNENIRKKRSDNRSGYLGVYFDKKSGKFRAQIRHNRAATTIGYFDDPAAAHKAYLLEKRRLHAGCTI